MKKKVVLAFILGLNFLVLSQPAAYAHEWRPVAEMTNDDYSLLFATGVREVSAPIVQFARPGDYVILLRLQNGLTVMAAYGHQIYTSGKAENEIPKITTPESNPVAEVKSDCNPNTETVERNIVARLANLNTESWTDGDTISKELEAIEDDVHSNCHKLFYKSKNLATIRALAKLPFNETIAAYEVHRIENLYYYLTDREKTEFAKRIVVVLTLSPPWTPSKEWEMEYTPELVLHENGWASYSMPPPFDSIFSIYHKLKLDAENTNILLETPLDTILDLLTTKGIKIYYE